MSAPQIPEDAVEAGRQALVKLLGPGEITFYDTERFAYGASQVFTDAALPHIERAVIQRLIEKAEAQVQAILNANHGRTPVGVGSDGMAYTQAVIAKGWLRAELEGDDRG